ncbi:hypothetical protein JRQ81_007323 [Phrynocephalus forsythii]|uniref:Uncharacterized protein n=1 Tax=Phrynocephalus forsythii TaxID=171643 RepID=A0A9Q0XD82_9SAUR|nr:hypothetical protein JRQ81_007323 [Phrynocephalus forsythii]
MGAQYIINQALKTEKHNLAGFTVKDTEEKNGEWRAELEGSKPNPAINLSKMTDMTETTACQYSIVFSPRRGDDDDAGNDGTEAQVSRWDPRSHSPALGSDLLPTQGQPPARFASAPVSMEITSAFHVFHDLGAAAFARATMKFAKFFRFRRHFRVDSETLSLAVEGILQRI